MGTARGRAVCERDRRASAAAPHRRHVVASDRRPRGSRVHRSRDGGRRPPRRAGTRGARAPLRGGARGSSTSSSRCGRSAPHSIRSRTGRCSASQPGAGRGIERGIGHRLRSERCRAANAARRIVSFWNDVDVVLSPTLALPRSRSAGRTRSQAQSPSSTGHRVHAVHVCREPHGASRNVAPPPLVDRRAAGRRPGHRSSCRGRAPALTRRRDRVGAPVG